MTSAATEIRSGTDQSASLSAGVPRWCWLIPSTILAIGVIAALLVAGSPAAHPDWASWTTLSAASRSALTHLRDASGFQWYVVPLLVFVIYVYSVEVERGHWNSFFAGLAVFGMDWFNELWNGLVLHFTQTSAVWVTPGHSALVLLPGWTIEIAFMFAISGIAFANLLHRERDARVVWVPNRWFWAFVLSVFAVFVEVLLNRADALVWHWPWWNWPNVWLILLFGYLHFFVVGFIVYDLRGLARKILVVGSIFAFDIAATLVFVVSLGWM